MAAALEPGQAALVGADTVTGWESRLRPGAYTAPSGTKIGFLCTETRRTVMKRGTVFEFADINGGYVQQHGFGPRQYPLRCVFNGTDHDLEATAFESAVYERGLGVLEHPKYGKIQNVVPFGAITRRDDLVFAANQSVLDLVFWTSLVDVYPSASRDPKSEIDAALDAFADASAQEFEAAADLSTAASRASTRSTVRSALREVSSALRSASEATSSVRQEFSDAFDAVNLGIDVLVGQPVLLARQLVNLVRAPARAASGIQSRLDGYAALVASLTSAPYAKPDPTATQASRRRKQRNDMLVAQQLGMASVAGSVDAVLANTFSTKPDAVQAASLITQLFDDLVAWREPAYLDAGVIDEGGAYQQLLHAVALAAGFLVEISFSLIPERRVTLDRARTIIDLEAELYGTVDENLDRLIASNDLSGSEILELPRGTTIAYYA